jgi:hypothetical protein
LLGLHHQGYLSDVHKATHPDLQVCYGLLVMLSELLHGGVLLETGLQARGLVTVLAQGRLQLRVIHRVCNGDVGLVETGILGLICHDDTFLFWGSENSQRHLANSIVLIRNRTM